MIEVQGVGLDFELMLADSWALYFTSGVYQGNGVIKTISPAIIRLKKSDYADYNLEVFDVFYNPFTSDYAVTQREAGTLVPNICDDGIHLGGFIVNDCILTFTYPLSENVTYTRPFEDPAFNEGYENRSLITENGTAASFNIDFSDEFITIDPTPEV